jgi:hypothetical protein
MIEQYDSMNMIQQYELRLDNNMIGYIWSNNNHKEYNLIILQTALKQQRTFLLLLLFMT